MLFDDVTVRVCADMHIVEIYLIYQHILKFCQRLKIEDQIGLDITNFEGTTNRSRRGDKVPLRPLLKLIRRSIKRVYRRLYSPSQKVQIMSMMGKISLAKLASVLSFFLIVPFKLSIRINNSSLLPFVFRLFCAHAFIRAGFLARTISNRSCARK